MKIRTSKPGKGNKYYIRKASGGWSPCIKGKPADKDCDALANCVAYAIGRVNEESNEGKITFFTKSMNAENFYKNAYKWGMETGSEPKQGAIMCWAKGKAGDAKDGAGHVAIVEKVLAKDKVYTSESGYNSFVFKNKTRSKGKNNNWGASSPYHFQGFIYNPHLLEVYPGVDRNDKVDQIQVKVDNLKIKASADAGAKDLFLAQKDGYYNVLATTSDSAYNWYMIEDGKWVAGDKEGAMVEFLPKVEPPKPTGLQIGDKVKIIGPYASSANSKNAPHTYAIGWVKYITNIYEGANYPYQVGNKGDTSSKGTTGFCKESSLQKL